MPKERPPKFRVLPLNSPEGKLKWRIDGYVGQRRVQKKFETKPEAEKRAKRYDLENDHYKEIALTAKDHVFMQDLNQYLKDTGKTHADILAYVKRFEKIKSVRFSEFAERLLLEVNRNPRSIDFPEYSKHTKEYIRSLLPKLNEVFADRYVADITPDDIIEWLKTCRKKDGGPLRTRSLNTFRGNACTVFRFAVLWKYTDVSPMRGVPIFDKTKEEQIEDNLKAHEQILSADSMEKLLHTAERFDPEIIPYIAIPAFTGLRSETLERLDWSDIQLSNKQMFIPGYKGKNRKAYPVQLPDNLIEWLRPFEKESGSLLLPSNGPGNFGQPSKYGSRSRLRFIADIAHIHLPHNTFRHTFISMDVTLHGNIFETGTKTNTSPEIIKEHYLGKVKNREDAVKYFNIRPQIDPALRLHSCLPFQYHLKLTEAEADQVLAEMVAVGMAKQPPSDLRHLFEMKHHGQDESARAKKQAEADAEMFHAAMKLMVKDPLFLELAKKQPLSGTAL